MRRRSGRSGSRRPSSTHRESVARTARPSVWPTSFSPRRWFRFVTPRSDCAMRSHLVAAEPLVRVADLPGAGPRALHAEQPPALSRLSGDHRPRLCGRPARRRARLRACPGDELRRAAAPARRPVDAAGKDEMPQNVAAMNIFGVGCRDARSCLPRCFSARPSALARSRPGVGLEEDGRRHLR